MEMRSIYKNDKIRKYEKDLKDMETWINLELIPNKEIPRIKNEIQALKDKIKDEHKKIKDFSIRERKYSNNNLRRQVIKPFDCMPTVTNIDIDDNKTEEHNRDLETKFETTVIHNSIEDTQYDDSLFFRKDKRWKENIEILKENDDNVNYN